MAILVTGGAGYIGSHTVLELLAAGEKVVVLDNLSTGFRSAVPEDVPLILGDFGDDPQGRIGQSTPNATHLIKVAVQTALGRRAGMEVFGTDYPTPDGSCLRDYIQVTDLARAHVDALNYLRAGGGNLTCNVGYAR